MNCLRLNEKEPLKAAEALKTNLIEMGIAPLPPHKELLKSIKNYDNPWLQPRTKRRDWAKGLPVKISQGKMRLPVFCRLHPGL